MASPFAIGWFEAVLQAAVTCVVGWKALPIAQYVRGGDHLEHTQEVEQHKKLVSQGWRPAVGSTVYVPRLNASLKVCHVCSCK